MAGLFEIPNPVPSNILSLEDEKEKTAGIIQSISQQQQQIKPKPEETLQAETEVDVKTAEVSGVTPAVKEVVQEELLPEGVEGEEVQLVGAEEVQPAEEEDPLSEEELRDRLHGYRQALSKMDTNFRPNDFIANLRYDINQDNSAQDAIDAERKRLNDEEAGNSTLAEVFSSIGDFSYGLAVKAPQRAFGNIIDTVEDGINYVFDTDINIADIEPLPSTSTSEQVGMLIGTEIPAIAAGFIATGLLTASGGGAPAAVATGALTLSRVGRLSNALVRLGGSAKRATPGLLAFEAAYAGVSQFTHRPDEMLLQDMFIDNPGLDKDSVNQYLEGNVTNPDSLRRLKMAGESMVFGGAFSIIFNGLGRTIRAFKSEKNLKRVAKNMTGQGKSLLSQRQRLEEYLTNHGGYSPAATSAAVREGMDKGLSIKEIGEGIVKGKNIEDIDKIVIGDEAALKRITARNVLETTGEMGTDEALDAVVKLEAKGILDESITKIVGASPKSFLDQATVTATKLLEKVGKTKEGESILMGRKQEAIKVGLYDAASLDGVMQEALTGLGGNATKIWKAFEQSGGKTDFFSDVSQSPYVLASLQSQRAKGHANQFIQEGKQFNPIIPGAAGKSQTTGAMSLGNITSKQGWGIEQADEFFHYVRAEKMLVDHSFGIGSKATVEELEAIVAKGRATQGYAEALGDYGTLQKTVLDYSVAAGNISRKEAQNMIARATNNEGVYVYSPRNVAEGQLPKLVGRKSPRNNTSGYKGLTGTERELRNPFLDVVEDITTKIYKGQANITKTARYKMIERAKRIGSPEVKELANRLTKEIDLKAVVGAEKGVSKGIVEGLRSHLKSLTELNKSIVINVDEARSLLKDSLDDLKWNDLLRVAGDNVQFRAEGRAFDVYFDAGTRKMVEITDPALIRMLDSQGATDALKSGFVKDILATTSGLTRAYSSFITKTPWFAAKSLIRDGFFAEMISPIGLLPKFRAVRGLFALVANPKVIKEMKAAGWSGGTKMTEIQKGWSSPNVLRAAGESAENINKAERQSFLRGLMTGGVNKWTNFVNNAEMASRVGEYIVAKGAGASDDFAVFMSQESLVNFGKQGTSSAWRLFTDHQVFFRPTYLGMAKTGEALRFNPVKSALYLSSMAATLHASEAVSSLYPDYKTKSEQDKNLWTYFPNVDAGEMLKYLQGGMKGPLPTLDRETPWITIPAVHELQALSRGMQKIYSLATEQGYSGSGMSILKELKEGLTPMMSTHYLTPTLLSPLLEAGLNDSKYHDGGILRESQLVANNKELVVNPSTGEFGRRLSEWTKVVDSVIFGGAGDAWFTPVIADYVLNQYFVGFASYGKNMLDVAGRESLKGEAPKSFFGDNSKSANLFDYMGQNMANIFFDSPAAGRALETYTYEMNSLVSGLNFKDKAVRKRFLTTLGRATVKDYSGGEVLLSRTSKVSRKVQEFLQLSNQRKSIIRNSDTYSAEVKRQELLLLEEKETHLLLQYQKSVEQIDHNKILKEFKR